ncbi:MULTISPECIES: flagellar protein FliT [Duganella]|uniref:Flagellar protein FliT n=1 Tax=Duganella zoogloeoides TaxID=75659 RepID=A0ABZ0XUE2_9BURK|nr:MULTISPECIES: flagellar protein FliT [Duganella]MPQ59837.1 flagellar protein FliT [Duganella sp. FT27W]WQH03361.1 flagellar protein FliT [Duganella zoogloeoides]
MNTSEVLAMYENIAGLSTQMAAAARMGDWDGVGKLETQCTSAARATATGVPALDGAPRLRKIDLLKQILANDREIRDLADPWMNTVPGMARQ